MENITPPPATATAKFSHETKCCLEFLKNNSEKKRKQQKGIDIKELTDEMRTGKEIEEMTIGREETVTEIRSTTLEKGRDTAINRRWTKKPRNQQGGTPTQPSATQHMTDNRSFLINFVPTVPERWSVSGIGESSLTVAGREDVVITATEGRTPAWNDERSAFRPWIGHQPLLDQYRNWHWPQGSLCRRRCLFFSRRCDLHGRKRARMKALYHINIQAQEHQPTIERALSAAHVAPLSLWRQRFGHLSHKTVLRMSTLESVFGLALFNNKLHLSTHCRRCLLGKPPRNAFQSTRTKGTQVGDIVHSDVCGPLHICTPGGAWYFVTFKDDFSSFCDIQLWKHKSEGQEAFNKFNAKMKFETGQATKILRSDGGGQFSS